MSEKQTLSYVGLKCPEPTIRLGQRVPDIAAGTTVEVHADCPFFQFEVKKWCEDNGKVLVSIVDQDNFKVATIQF